MIIGGHMVFVAAEGIGQAVIHHVHKKIKIHTTHGFQNNTLSFAGTETRHFALQDIGITLITGKSKAVFVLAFSFLTPFNKIVVYLFSESFAACQRNNAKRACRDCF